MKALVLFLSLMVGSPAAPATSVSDSVVALQDKKEKKTQTVTFKTTMHCDNCVRKVTENLSFLRGVKDLKISLDEKTVTITYDPARTNEQALAEAIRKLGYEVEKLES